MLVIVATDNDHPSYVKYALDRINCLKADSGIGCVCVGGWGVSLRRVVHNLLMQFAPWAAPKAKFLKLIFFDMVTRVFFLCKAEGLPQTVLNHSSKFLEGRRPYVHIINSSALVG